MAGIRQGTNSLAKSLIQRGLYYYGARYYDPVLNRWISADPAFDRYLPELQDKEVWTLPGYGGVYNSSNLGSYGYANHNPIRVLDPDGRKILIYPGLTSGQKNQVLKTVQQLTSDKLVLKNNEIKINSQGSGKTKGTELIRRMVQSTKTATIDIAPAGKGNGENDVNSADASSKGSDAIVHFDPTSNPDIKTLDPKTGKVSA